MPPPNEALRYNHFHTDIDTSDAQAKLRHCYQAQDARDLEPTSDDDIDVSI